MSYPQTLNINKLKAYLKDKGYAFLTGYGVLSSYTFRIPHMGDLTLPQLYEYLKVIKDYVLHLM